MSLIAHTLYQKTYQQQKAIVFASLIPSSGGPGPCRGRLPCRPRLTWRRRRWVASGRWGWPSPPQAALRPGECSHPCRKNPHSDPWSSIKEKWPLTINILYLKAILNKDLTWQSIISPSRIFRSKPCCASFGEFITNSLGQGSRKEGKRCE